MTIPFLVIKPEKSLQLLLTIETIPHPSNTSRTIIGETVSMEWTRSGMEKAIDITINTDEWRDYVIADVKEALDAMEKDDQQTILIAQKATDKHTIKLVLHPATYKSESGWVYGMYSTSPLSQR